MPSCFISYSRESDHHQKWVRGLAERLQASGVEVRFDEWDLSPGSDLPQFMETSVRESDYVLLVCTPKFAQKANGSSDGVGYEKAVVSGEIFYANRHSAKFVPVLRVGEPNEALPSYLLSKVFVDFRNDLSFEQPYEELLRHLHRAPRYSRPPLGSAPVLTQDRPGTDLTGSVKNENRYGTDAAQGAILNYCSRCGEVPGKQSRCTGSFTHHQFAAGSVRDFCARCGARPGNPSVCTGSFTHHSFQVASCSGRATALDYCGRCGEVPGDQNDMYGELYTSSICYWMCP